MDGMTVKLKNKTIGYRTDLAASRVSEAVEPAIPIATLHIPTLIAHGSASIIKRPCFHIDSLMPDAGCIQFLLDLCYMYGLLDHQLNVASKVLSKIRPAREKSSLLWLRRAYR